MNIGRDQIRGALFNFFVVKKCPFLYLPDTAHSFQNNPCEDIENEQNELYKLRSDSVFDVIKKDCVIALYSPPNSLELFYLCKVKEFGIA